jgi:hypothetical protein
MHEIASLLAAVLIVIIAFVVSLLIAGVVNNWKEYKYYKITYKSLVSGLYHFHDEWEDNYVFVKNGMTWKEAMDHETGTIIFFKSGAIQLLKKGMYIHSSVILLFASPYSLYWFKKLNKWLIENRHKFVEE